jgi:hypothetical protein
MDEKESQGTDTSEKSPEKDNPTMPDPLKPIELGIKKLDSDLRNFLNQRVEIDLGVNDPLQQLGEIGRAFEKQVCVR